MGASVIRCFLGFPTFRNTPAGESLEREGRRMADLYRGGHSQMLRGFELLHDAVDAALAGDIHAMAGRGRHGIRRLERSAGAIAELAGTLERSRKALAELVAAGSDPLALREPGFARLDAEGLAVRLARGSGGAADRALWGEMAQTLVRGGGVAGLRLLERTAWRLQTALREQAVRSRQALTGTPEEVARALHSTGLAGAVLADLWATFLRQAGYLSLLCEEATRLWEAEVEREEARTA